MHNYQNKLMTININCDIIRKKEKEVFSVYEKNYIVIFMYNIAYGNVFIYRMQ